MSSKPPFAMDKAAQTETSACRKHMIEWAAEAGDAILGYWHRGFNVSYKEDATPVTEADREAEVILRKHIGQTYPHHGIIGEEFGNDRADAEWVWVLDPIDGTKSFLAGIPLFGTLIGLLHQGTPVLGLIHQPVLKQMCVGDGRVTTLNNQNVWVRDCANLQEALLLTSGLETFCKQPGHSGWQRLIQATRVSRTWGDCYGYLMVASARADIMVDPVLNPWDLLPLIPIIRGAGGTITDWHGGDPVRGESAVAAGPRLHAQVIKILRQQNDAG